MKILVASDSHHYKNTLSEIIAAHMDAAAIIFLGDGLYDFEDALAENGIDPFSPSREVICVQGNCDRFAATGFYRVVQLGGKNFYITHGAQENVKLGLWTLVDEAKKHGCSIALYGHTHFASYAEKNGIITFNPGTAARGEYGLIEISPAGLYFEHKILE